MADRDPIAVLWLCGAPGVGKSTVGWEVYNRRAEAGSPAAYVDVDQLGICYPEPDDDPGRYVMKATNLAAVAANFRAAGTTSLVVSGVVDSSREVPTEVPGATLTVCRLHADAEELRTRLLGRGMSPDTVPGALEEADVLERNGIGDLRIETTRLTVPQVADLVIERTQHLPGQVTGAVGREPKPPEPDGPPILWLCGPTAVGKSTIGWLLYESIRATGVTAAYVDLDQVGFRRQSPTDDPHNHRIKASNLAALYETYRAAGATCLVAVGPVDDADDVRTYIDAVPAGRITLCRLHAGPDELKHRIQQRGTGSGWPDPADQLKGQPAAVLDRIAAEAAATADALERKGIGDLRIDTDGRTPEAVAASILEALPTQ